MKLTGIIILAAALHVSAAGWGQTVTYSAKEVPLTKVLSAIEQQTGLNVFYDEADLMGTKPVTVDFKSTPFIQVLQQLLPQQGLKFQIEGNTISISRAPAVQPATSNLPPPGEVHGRVTDSAGAPLAGASVEVRGSKKGAVTDAKGDFELKDIAPGAILVITYSGYQGKEVTVSESQESIVVRLELSNNPLDEIQVIAYGTVSKRLNTGDVTTVSAKEIGEEPIENPLEALEGRVPGLFITQNTGKPGSSYTVQLRGQNSIQNGNDPLYVIDGVPYSSKLLTGFNPSGGNPLNFINPSDIESIDVLKDADATAIYGSRAANGVVLITTKKAKPGRTVGDLNVYTGWGNITRKVKYLNTPQYLEMRHEAFANDGLSPGPTDYDINGTWDTTRYTDWEKLLIGGTAKYWDAQGSVSGGNASTQFVLGGNYHRQTTVFPGNSFEQRGTANFGINHVSTDHKFKAQLSGNYMVDNNNLISVDFTSMLSQLPPDAPAPYNPDGTINWANSTWPWGESPMSQLLVKYKSNTSNLVANSTLAYTIAKGLEIYTSMGYTSMVLKEIGTAPTTSTDPAFGITSGSADFTNNTINSWIVEPQAKFTLDIGKGQMQTLIGATFQENNSYGQVLAGTGFASDALLQNLQAAKTINVLAESNVDYKYNAIFGRLNYNWADKYLLNLTVRRDGSSRFGPGRQFANFGAVGAAWLFTNERFIKKLFPFLSSGKMRGSYGTNGNDQIGDYTFLNLYNSSRFSYNNSSSLSPANLFNPDLAWELIRKIEGGLELGAWKNRVLLSASYYRNRSSNQLVPYGVSAVTGFTSIKENLPALVQNSGVEITASTVNVRSAHFRWTTGFNIALPRNKLVSYPGLASSSYNSIYVVGQPLTIKRLFHMAGVNDTTGVYQFSAGKGGVTYSPTSPNDLTVNINTMPKYYGGLQNSFQYGNFGLDVLFQFVRQTGHIFPYNLFAGAYGNQEPSTVLSRWRKSGDMANIEKFGRSYGGATFQGWLNAYNYSDQVYGDASYVRLKDLAISYAFPVTVRQKMHVQNLRVYLQAQNLLTITKYVGYDPENQSIQSLPPLRVVTAGIQCTF